MTFQLTRKQDQSPELRLEATEGTSKPVFSNNHSAFIAYINKSLSNQKQRIQLSADSQEVSDSDAAELLMQELPSNLS